MGAWEGLPDTVSTYIDVYKTFLHTPQASIYVPHFACELSRAEQHITECENSDSEDESPAREQHEEWMHLCRLNHHYTTNTQQDDSINWSEYAQSLPPETLQECPRWIKLKRQESCSSWNRHLLPTDITTLNGNQKKAYDHICNHYQQLQAGKNHQPLRMIICGTAGTGKSYLISAIAQKLQNQCLLTATTGMAAFNVCGQTLHSALQLPIKTFTFKDL